jgi:predicted anti-sigma-YlaC factor YlaD
MTAKKTPLTCRDTTYLVSESRDAPLDAEQNELLADHLKTCDACRTASTQFAQLFAQLDSLLARKRP